MEDRTVAIQVSRLEKAYKLYDKPSDRLKEALGLSRKKKYKEHYALKGVDLTIYHERFRQIHYLKDYYRSCESHQGQRAG